jgi:hypothetical protein
VALSELQKDLNAMAQSRKVAKNNRPARFRIKNQSSFAQSLFPAKPLRLCAFLAVP